MYNPLAPLEGMDEIPKGAWSDDGGEEAALKARLA